jgi:hypothetical protein
MNQNALWISFDEYRFVLGMEWRLLEPTEKLVRRTLGKLRREGLQWYASRGVQDFVGICSNIPESKNPMYSAALHLADQWSSGGIELFAFGMPQQRVAVLALNEGRPVPGFDFVGTMSEAQALIEEFEALHQGAAVRRVGDLGLLADEEQLSAQTVFDQPRAETKLKPLPSLKALLFTGGLVVMGFAALAGLYYWQIHEREDLLLNLPKPGPSKPQDPNPAYLVSANQMVQSLGAQGHFLYQAWLQTTKALPLAHRGWVMTQIECKGETCSADWRRQYGSVEDFYTQPPPQTSQTQHLSTGNDALSQGLQTQHPAKVKVTAKGYEKATDLPTQSQGFRQLSSWLQDLSLIGVRGVSVEKALVWQAPTEGIALKQPLLKGTWSAEIPLGLAPDLVVPPFATVSLLKTTLGNSYQLSGNYYVRADTP